MTEDNFVHLHVHTEYSLLDGACRIRDLIKHIKSVGQTAVAITDHGNMYGAAEFWSEAVNAGIKPIIGCEVYVAPRTRHHREHSLDSKPYHLILLCETDEGYKNLVKLVTAANLEGFYGRPRVDTELLEKYHKGLICLSACLSGEIARLLLNNQYAQAKEKALQYRDIFGEDNYFLEVQNHDIKDEKRIIPLIYRLSDETGISLAATNDCHYINKKDAETQKILMCIQTGRKLSDPDAMSFETDEFYVKSAQEMYSLFRDRRDALENTVRIAERCNVRFNFGNIMLPEFKTDGVENNDEYFRELCIKGMYERYGKNPSEKIHKRLEYELSVIISMKFTDYFLIVWDFIKYARDNNIPVGPGRGSGAGSICAYCIGITGIDPMKYDLLFERFLNPERVSMPDFDVDFCIEGRQSVKDYVSEKYGRDKVAGIIAFDTLKARAAVKDVGRVMEIPYSLCDRVSKLIDPRYSLETALKDSSELKALYNSERDVRRLIDNAMLLEGMPRHTSMHAAGVVISAVPLSDIVPLQKSDENIITQYTMNYLEKLGLLKMDFLGLRNLTIIRDTVREIPGFDINGIPLDDREVYEMLSQGDTAGVFQMESVGMTQKLIDMSPERTDDLIAILALYRPGPMKSIPLYIENKKDPSKIKYAHPLLKDILCDTYGIIVYQEQVMKICRKLAGYTYGHADKVRKAMAKKKTDEMLREHESFVSGAAENGIPRKIAENIFSEMSSFASYAFNKSHAAAYAYLAYQTAYLKCHYRGIYMAALMSSVMSSADKLSEYINDCRNHGINITPPNINISRTGFVFADGKMYFGLLAVKNVGKGLAEKIISERETGGKFRSLQDFCERINGRELNKKALEYLIYAGAFDNMGLNRRQMSENYETFMDMAVSDGRGVIEGQMNLFGEDENADMNFKVPSRPEFEPKRLYSLEKEAAGVYLTGDPLSEYEYLGNLLKTVKINDALNPENHIDGDKLKFLCIIREKKEHTTRKGDKMCFLTLADSTGEIDAVMFPDIYAVCGRKIHEDSIIFLRGKLSARDDEINIICTSAAEENEFERIIENMKLCIKTRSDDLRIKNIIPGLCGKYHGNTGICYYFSDTGKTVRLREKQSIKISRELYSELCGIFGSTNTGLIEL
ncbi:MAG: DNA polymerase III subunit alpha [Ruminococcus sp.]|nr:DNA polymerase III subunit alpha [Ruminococcus sp.]